MLIVKVYRYLYISVSLSTNVNAVFSAKNSPSEFSGTREAGSGTECVTERNKTFFLTDNNIIKYKTTTGTIECVISLRM